MAEGNGAVGGATDGLLVEVARTVSQQAAVLDRHGVLLERIGATLGMQDDRLRYLETNMATKSDVAATKADITGLRHTVGSYHSSVVGHGILVSGLEARVQRVETLLDLPPFVHG